MLATVQSSTFDSSSDIASYQAVSRSAIASVILGVMGILGFWLVPLLALSLLGLAFALMGLRNLARFQEELTVGRSP